jgi:hypothetical protein
MKVHFTEKRQGKKREGITNRPGVLHTVRGSSFFRRTMDPSSTDW